MATEIVPVPDAVLAAEFPTNADREAGQWNAKASAWAGSENAMVTRTREIAVSTHTNSTAAKEQALAAAGAALTAGEQAQAAELSASQAAADRVQTGLDRLATAADRQAVEQAIVNGPVLSVNDKSGVVELDAEDVGALPDSGEIPRYDLASAATTTTLDLAASNIFRVDASSPRTLVFANAPTAGRAIGVLVKINGSSEITWPSGIEWDQGTAPQLGATWTDVGLINDGSVWTGSVRASA